MRISNNNNKEENPNVPAIENNGEQKRTLHSGHVKNSELILRTNKRIALTPAQNRFVAEYLKDRKGKDAAIRAGYSAATASVRASKLLSHPGIRELVQASEQKIIERAMISKERVLQDIALIGARCMQAEPVFDREGNPTGEYTFDASNALRAKELLGRHLELFTDKVKQTGDVSVNVVIHEENVGKMEKK